MSPIILRNLKYVHVVLFVAFFALVHPVSLPHFSPLSLSLSLTLRTLRSQACDKASACFKTKGRGHSGIMQPLPSEVGATSPKGRAGGRYWLLFFSAQGQLGILLALHSIWAAFHG